MAAPHVAGAIALLKEAFPRTAVDDIVKALRETGKIVRDPRNGLKRPRIDVDRAFKLLAGQN